MQPQFILRVVGIAALVVAVLFALLAVHYYLTQNIRAVMDDLSGKTRARGVAGARTRVSSDSRRSETHRSSRQNVAPAAGSVDSASPTAQPRRAEVTPAPQPMPMAFEDEDDTGTVLVGAVHSGASAAGDTSQKPSPAPETVPGDKPLFRITRSIVLIHSQEVIATSEEPLV